MTVRMTHLSLNTVSMHVFCIKCFFLYKQIKLMCHSETGFLLKATKYYNYIIHYNQQNLLLTVFPTLGQIFLAFDVSQSLHKGKTKCLL